MGRSLNVLLVAEEAAGAQTLTLLSRAGHHVVGVVTKLPTGRNGKATLWPVAQRLGFDTLPAKLMKDPSFPAQLRSWAIDLILNVHSLFIIPAAVLETARIGAFNLHPGPLPRYAGLNAVSWAIYRGEVAHGVTVHWMTPEIDTGPIAYQTRFPIEEKDTALCLAVKCVRAGIPLLERLLTTAATEPRDIPWLPQDLTQREYFNSAPPQESKLNWARPAKVVVDFVRACDYFPFPSPWGYPKSKFSGGEVAVMKASRTGDPVSGQPPGIIGSVSEQGALVACSDEWVNVRWLLVDGQRVPAMQLLRQGERLDG